MSETISFKNITKYYYDKSALSNASFEISRGVIHGLLGPNGAGKSTTMKILTGLLEPSMGEVDYFGKKLKDLCIGYVPEFPPLYPNLTVLEFLNFCAKLREIKNKTSSIDLSIERCGLSEVKNRLIKNLSKGYKQKVSLAQALVVNPDVLVLDEPTSGLDPASIIQMRELIKSLKGECTILISTHLLHEASIICDEITVLDRGTVLKTGDLENIVQGFNANQVVRAKVLKWEEEQMAKLRSELGCEVSAMPNGEGTKLTMYFNDVKEKRTEVSNWLVANDCGLLYLDHDNPDLEEIFKQITTENAQ